MGLFSYNYNKEGPGVDKNAPPKRKFINFFESFSEKFWSLCGLNVIFVLCSLIPIVSAVAIYLLTKNIQVALIPLIPITLPLCGMTCITNKYTRDESVFLWSDFKDAVKSNWMQAIIVGVFNYIFVALMSFVLPFYWNLAQEQILYYAFFLIMLTFCLVFLFVQFYIYIMIVVFKLDIKSVFKNSLIFSIANLWPNLLVAVITLSVMVICMYMVELIDTPLLGGIVIILAFGILFAALSFLTNFAVWPKIKELMLVKDKEEEPAEDTHDEAEYDSDEDEYIFENGRMVKKRKE